MFLAGEELEKLDGSADVDGAAHDDSFSSFLRLSQPQPAFRAKVDLATKELVLS